MSEGIDPDRAIRVESVSRDYGRGASAVDAVRDVSFTAPAGQLIAVLGRSGAGKTSLLNIVGGLGEHANQRPYELSGGQQQRAAVARALANNPQILIADEPTGQLDSETGQSIMDLMRAVVSARSMTALVATHDAALLDRADRVITLRDGALVDDELVASSQLN